MVIEQFIDFFFNNCVNVGISMFDRHCARKSEREAVKEYADRYFHQIFVKLALSEAFDFQPLHEFILRELERSIALSFYLPRAFERKRLRESIYLNAYAYAGADTTAKQKLVYQYMNMLFSVLETFYMDRTDNILIANHTIDEMKHILDEVQGELSETLKSVQAQLKQVMDKMEYKNSFMEMIDRIKPKDYNSVPFHYLNPAICFHGRETEMAALDAFRKDDRQILFFVLTGSGGAGKSRLIFEYAKSREYQIEWEFTYLAGEQVRRLSSFHEFYFIKKLFLIIDYAGSQAEEIGDWLYEICQCRVDCLPPKLRVVLIERQGVLYDDNGSALLPQWVDRLLGCGEREIRLKEIAYHFSGESFGYLMELQELPDETLWRIIRNYAGKCGGEWGDNSCEYILKRAREVSKLSGLTPLTVLLVEDFVLDAAATNNMEYQELFGNAIEKWEMSWKRTLCDNDPELFQAVELLLIFSTAVGRISITDSLSSCYQQALDYLLEQEADSVVAIICGLNGSDRFDGHINPLEPDLIGEFYFLEYLRRRRFQKKELAELLPPLWEHGTFAEFLDRCYDDFSSLSRFQFLFVHNGHFIIPDSINEGADSLCLFLFYMACKPDNRHFGEAVMALTELAVRNPENKTAALTLFGMFNNLQKRYFDGSDTQEVPELFWFLYQQASRLRDRYLDDENKMMAYTSAVFILSQHVAVKEPDSALRLLKELFYIQMHHKYNSWISANVIKAICCYCKEGRREREYQDFFPYVLRTCGNMANQNEGDIKLLEHVLKFSIGVMARLRYQNCQNKEEEICLPLMEGDGFMFYSQDNELLARLEWDDFHNPKFLQANFGADHALVQLLTECFEALERREISRAKQLVHDMDRCVKREPSNPFPAFAYAVALFSLSNAQELPEAAETIIALREESVRNPEITDIFALFQASLTNQAEKLTRQSDFQAGEMEKVTI